MGTTLLVVAVFLACLVEAVEALTIVLAVGISRGWRSVWQGVVAGLLTLAVVIALVGPALTTLPLDLLRLVVGGLLLVFGLGWLRKAILRASGLKALHDEDAIYARQAAAAATARRSRLAVVEDGYAFTLAFKGVLLEGLEVAFIVVTFGSNQGRIGLAVLGAVAAVTVVLVAGLVLRAPLARVPENTLKFGVGVLLTSFGLFWGGEGAGARWPGSDAALPVLIALVLAFGVGTVWLLRRAQLRGAGSLDAPAAGASS